MKLLQKVVVIAALAICILPDSKADYYAAQNGQAPSGAYTTWESAASNIQDAVNAAPTNGTVWVGAGRYTLPTNAVVYKGTNVVYINKPLTLRSSNSVPSSAFIDGSGMYRGIAVDYPSDSTNRFLIDGFTISNCFVDMDLTGGTNGGAGIIFNSGNYTGVVQNCLISDNTVTGNPAYPYRGGGGGIFSYSALYYVISNCTFRGNRVLHPAQVKTGGGGVWLGCSLSTKTVAGEINNCLFESNSVVNGGGGGLFFSGIFGNSTNWIKNCVIRNNSQTGINAEVGGGGIQIIAYTGLTMWNCLVYNNCGTVCGGIINMKSSFALTMYNCTVVSNYNGGIFGRDTSDHVVMYNSIIYSNNSYDVTINTNASNIFTNNCTGMTNLNLYGTGNITNNPAFVNFADKNFRLTHNSPCVNRGLNQAWMTNAVDLDGKIRIRYGTVDMGAYEVIYDGTIYKFH